MSEDTTQKAGITLLWALRSACNMGCRYCYFGVLEEDLVKKMQPKLGELSHLGKDDVALPEMIKFVNSLPCGLVKRVVLAGGEPLAWFGTRGLVRSLKNKGCSVMIATNGLLLINPTVCEWLIEEGVEAVSVSVDSVDPESNDAIRIDYQGKGVRQILKGLEQLADKVKERKSPLKIGIYSVVTKENINQLSSTFAYFEGRVDYFITQPVSLVKNHPYYSRLALQPEDLPILKQIITGLSDKTGRTKLACAKYLELMWETFGQESPKDITNCFGGKDLFFIEPDGTVWDCPSYYKIAASASEVVVSIKDPYTAAILAQKYKVKTTGKCNYFSKDCVNMWQLMAFDETLNS